MRSLPRVILTNCAHDVGRNGRDVGAWLKVRVVKADGVVVKAWSSEKAIEEDCRDCCAAVMVDAFRRGASTADAIGVLKSIVDNYEANEVDFDELKQSEVMAKAAAASTHDTDTAEDAARWRREVEARARCALRKGEMLAPAAKARVEKARVEKAPILSSKVVWWGGAEERPAKKRALPLPF